MRLGTILLTDKGGYMKFYSDSRREHLLTSILAIATVAALAVVVVTR